MGQAAVDKNSAVLRQGVALVYDLKVHGTTIYPAELKIFVPVPDDRFIWFCGKIGLVDGYRKAGGDALHDFALILCQLQLVYDHKILQISI